MNNILNKDFSKCLLFWRNKKNKIISFFNISNNGEIYLHINPNYKTFKLVKEMIESAEITLSFINKEEKNNTNFNIWIFANDSLLEKVAEFLKYSKTNKKEIIIKSILSKDIDNDSIDVGLKIRTIKDNEIDTLIKNLPLYRRDLDLVGEYKNETIAFCTLWYDDCTRTGYFEPIFIKTSRFSKIIEKKIILEAMKRIKNMGAYSITYKDSNMINSDIFIEKNNIEFFKWIKNN